MTWDIPRTLSQKVKGQCYGQTVRFEKKHIEGDRVAGVSYALYRVPSI